MDQHYQLRRGGRVVAEVRAWPLSLDGEPEVCSNLRGHLRKPVLRLAQSLDRATGERGTRLVSLAPGADGWLPDCLGRAARELALELREAPLHRS